MAEDLGRTDGPASRWEAGRTAWLQRQSLLRNVVRQELVARQLAEHLPAPPATVVDVGAGQGTQALRLARLGFDVTAVEPDPQMRAEFETFLKDLRRVKDQEEFDRFMREKSGNRPNYGDGQNV